jgi:hypothetical protein
VHAAAVVLDLMQPVVAGRRFGDESSISDRACVSTA